MKRTLLIPVLALSMAAPCLFAQQDTTAPAQTQSQTPAENGRHHQHHPRDPHKVAEKMAKRLDLNADQTAKLEPIIAARQQKMEALRADTTLTPDQRHEQMRAAMKESQDQLATVLTPEQMEKLRAMRQKHEQEHQHEHQDGEGATAPPTK